MSLLRHLESFDQGVEAAMREYRPHATTAVTDGFSGVLAGFAFYDIGAALNAKPEESTFLRLDGRLDQPLLWKHTHRSLAQVLRNDPDIAESYAGFATLFTLNRDAPHDAPRFPSMTIDAKLDAPGFCDLALSKKQFQERSTLPLTAACLRSPGDEKFKTCPIVFHWARTGHSEASVGAPDNADFGSWGHVLVTADVHYKETTGIEDDLSKTNFRVDDAKLIHVRNSDTANGSVRFNEAEFYRRLAHFFGDDQVSRTKLARMITWTVTYFVYACELFTGKRLNALSIVCAPASFDDEVTSALYVPIQPNPPGPRLDRIATKILLLARSLASPLWQLHELSAARRIGETEATSAILHQIPKDFGALDYTLTELRRFADSPDASIAEIRKLIPDTDATAVMLMEGDAAAEKPTYQLLPTEFPHRLQHELCSFELVNNLFDRLVTYYVRQRVLTLDDSEKCSSYDPFEHSPVTLNEAFPFPQLEKFDSFFLPDGRDIYIWLLFALRNSANHAYRQTIRTDDRIQGRILVSYEAKTDILTILNTGDPPKGALQRQRGWERDIRAFGRTNQKWKVEEPEAGIFSHWSDNTKTWKTVLKHL